MSLRLRMALMSAIAIAITIAIFGVAVFAVTALELYNIADGQLLAEQERLQDRFARFEAAPLPSGDGSVSINAYTPAGTLIRQTHDVTFRHLPIGAKRLDQALTAPDGTNQQYTALVGGNLFLLRVVTMRGTVLLPGTGPLVQPVAVQAVVLGEDVSSAYGTVRVLGLILIVAGIVVLAGSVGLVWLVAGRALRPVTQLTRAAETLGAGGELGRRLPLPPTRDEISRLSIAFNGSLDRLEEVYRELAESLSRQRRFVADASHELRTPLTVILSNAENLRDQPDLPVEERTEWLGEVIEESKRMADLSSDLLLLARADVDEPMRLGEVDWTQFFDDLRRDAERLCEPRLVDATSSGPLGSGIADHSALVRVFRVLFENIARYTPTSATVRLRAQRDGPTIVVHVADDGPGVPPAQLPHIFDRFFRADPSRHGRGTGLGLAIARQLVTRHHGEIAARNRPQGGLEFRIRLPLTLEGDGASAPGQGRIT